MYTQKKDWKEIKENVSLDSGIIIFFFFIYFAVFPAVKIL